MYKISLICPIKNEQYYLPIHIENSIDKVDEIIYCDTGCNDNSISIINSAQNKYGFDKIRIINSFVNSSYNWREGEIRNLLIEESKHDYILILDADEILSDDFSYEIQKYDLHQKMVNFRFIPFWKNLQTVRCSVKNDECWYPKKICRMFDKRYYKYEDKTNHSFLKPYIYDCSFNINVNIKLFHLHYALFKRCKPNDNRLWDLSLLEYWNQDRLPDVIEDFRFDTLPHFNYSLKTKEYKGTYPNCLSKYL